MSTRHHLKKVISVSLAVAIAMPLLAMAQQAEQAQAGAPNHTQARGQQAQGQKAQGQQPQGQQPQGQRQGDAQRRIQMFSSLDSNGDGALNFDEFSAMPRLENRPQGADTDEAIEQLFTRMDTDGNGLLSPEELQQGQRRGNGGGMRQRMENMTPEQREQMRERMQQMTPEQRQQMMQRRQGTNAAPAVPAAPTSE